MCLTDKYLWKTSPDKLKGKSTNPATCKMEFFVTLVNTVIYCHGENHYRRCRGPRYASATSYYKKFKDEQLQDNVNNNKNLVKQFFWGAIFLGGIFQGDNFPGLIFSGPFFREGSFFPRKWYLQVHKITEAIKWTSSKADTSLRRTKKFVSDEFIRNPL